MECVWTHGGNETSIRVSKGVEAFSLRYLLPSPSSSPSFYLSTTGQCPPGTGSLCVLLASGRCLNRQTLLYGMVGLPETREMAKGGMESPTGRSVCLLYTMEFGADASPEAICGTRTFPSLIRNPERALLRSSATR